VAKRTRGRGIREEAAVAPVERATRPRRRTAARSEQGALDRYRTPLIAGVALLGILIIGFMFFQGAATRGAYDCATLLTPGPVEQDPTPRPATPSPTPAATDEPSPGGTPDAGATPGTSPDGSPAAEASPTPQPTPAPEPTARVGFPTADLGRLHAPTGQPLTYQYCPPASGPHYNQPGAAPMPYTVYQPTQERAPGYWIHNLEHGSIVVLYRCPSGQLGQGDCITREELNQLEAFHAQAPEPPFSTCPNKTMVARFDSMETRFALLAWDRVLLVDEFDFDQAITFAEQWMEYDPIVLPERLAC
jgi:hypothetical protein